MENQQESLHKLLIDFEMKTLVVDTDIIATKGKNTWFITTVESTKKKLPEHNLKEKKDRIAAQLYYLLSEYLEQGEFDLIGYFFLDLTYRDFFAGSLLATVGLKHQDTFLYLVYDEYGRQIQGVYGFIDIKTVEKVIQAEPESEEAEYLSAMQAAQNHRNWIIKNSEEFMHLMQSLSEQLKLLEEKEYQHYQVPQLKSGQDIILVPVLDFDLYQNNPQKLQNIIMNGPVRGIQLYTPKDHRQKFQQCIHLVRSLLAKSIHITKIYDIQDEKKDNFYLNINQKEVNITSNGKKQEWVPSFMKILASNSANCEEYAIISYWLLRLKGFRVSICIESFGNYRHIYPIIKIATKEYFIVDVWLNTLARSNELPIGNQAQISGFSLLAQYPLAKDYWNQVLFHQLESEIGDNQKLQYKLHRIEKEWR